MDIKALIKNITYSLKSTAGIHNAVKNVFWLYKKHPLWGYKQTQITFKYKPPINKIKLRLRFNAGSDAFILSEVFEHNCYQTPLTDDVTTIVDLGANAGFTAIYFSKIFPKAIIACVEPIPGNIEVLKKNIALNNVNAIIIQSAVTVDDKAITMEIGDKDYGGKIHDIPFGKTMANGTLTVNGYSMDTIMKKSGFDKIDLLKIDIEGYEGVLFSTNTSWLEKVNAIIMEIHEGVSIEAIKSVTLPYGFTTITQQHGNWILTKPTKNQ